MLKLIVGCGYLGLRVARRWIAAGHAVAGLVRSAAAAESLAREAVRPIVADVTQPSTLRDLPAADTLLYAVGYDPAGGHRDRPSMSTGCGPCSMPYRRRSAA